MSTPIDLDEESRGRMTARLPAVGPFEKIQIDDLWNGPSGFGPGGSSVDRLTLVTSPVAGDAGRVVVAVTTVDNVTNGTRIQLLAPPGPEPLGGPSGR